MRRILLLGMTLAACSYADILTFTHTGTGTGQIGATTFTNASFIITETVNTADRQAFSGGFFIDDSSASITLGALGTFSFVTPTRTFVNNASEIIGFSRAGSSGLDLYNGPLDAVFATYDLLGPIGPISGFGSLMQWSAGAVDTSGGVLVFDTGGSDATFTATSGVPEPSSWILLITCMAGATRLIRRQVKGT